MKIGDWVRYDDGHAPSEVGRIKRITDKWIFVVFHCDNRWTEYYNFTAEACNKSYLKKTEAI